MLGYYYFDGICYRVPPAQYTFPETEVACLPTKDSSYRSQVAWSENTEHWDFMSQLMQSVHTKANSFWAGISDRDGDGFFITR